MAEEDQRTEVVVRVAAERWRERVDFGGDLRRRDRWRELKLWEQALEASLEHGEECEVERGGSTEPAGRSK